MALLLGTLEAFSETGSEGIVWAFSEAGKEGYDGFHTLKRGHILTVFNSYSDPSILWKGRVELDFKNRVEHIKIPAGTLGFHRDIEFDAQRIGGASVRGLPETCDEDLWLYMFQSEKPALLEF